MLLLGSLFTSLIISWVYREHPDEIRHDLLLRDHPAGVMLMLLFLLVTLILDLWEFYSIVTGQGTITGLATLTFGYIFFTLIVGGYAAVNNYLKNDHRKN